MTKQSHRGRDDSPMISVVIPLYNKKPHIARAIKSAIAQNRPAAEIVVVDDGSTDHGAEVVKKWRDRRVRLISQENRGKSAARNRGWRNAVGDYIAFLDADDHWEPEFLTTIAAMIEKYPDAGAYATNYFIWNPGRPAQPARICGLPRNTHDSLIPDFFQSVTLGNNPLWTSAACIRKSTLERFGGFPEDVRRYEDLYLWTRIALELPIAFARARLATYHREASNREFNRIDNLSDELAFARLIDDAIKAGTLSGPRAHFARRFAAKYELLNAFKLLLAGDSTLARRVATRATPLGLPQKARRGSIILLSRCPEWIMTSVRHASVCAKIMH